MRLLLDAFWRAGAYCLHPRVMLLSLLPLLVAAGGAFALGYFYWEAAVAGVRDTLEGWSLVAALLQWLDSVGAEGFRSVMAPLVVVALSVPVIVVVSLLLVALFMTPALVTMVARRRFPALEARHGGSFWQSALWSIGCTLIALIALALSLPLWFVPPLVLVLPPLIWGWLTYKVFTFDVLAEHASRAERLEIVRRHRWPLLGMGVIAGYLGAAPSMIWAASAALIVLAPILVVASVWLYTLVFAFSSLWFAHYALAALAALRAESGPAASPAPSLPPLPYPAADLASPPSAVTSASPAVLSPPAGTPRPPALPPL